MSGAWRWLFVACSVLVLVALVEATAATHAHPGRPTTAVASTGQVPDGHPADGPSAYLSEPTAPDDLADDSDADAITIAVQVTSLTDTARRTVSGQRIGTTRASIRGPPNKGLPSIVHFPRTTLVHDVPLAPSTSRTAARAVPSTLRVPSPVAHSVAFRPHPAAFASARAVPSTHSGHHATLPDVVVSAAARSSPVVSISVLRAGVTT